MTEISPGYEHDALFFGSQDELVQSSLSFLCEGLDIGEHVALVCTPGNQKALQEALGDREGVILLGQDSMYRRAADAVASHRRLMQGLLTDGAVRVRLVGEIDFGTEPESWREWMRFEAVCNYALASFPLWSLCAYDTSRLSPDIITAGELTHPYVRAGEDRVPNPRFTDPAELIDQLMPDMSRPVEATLPAAAIAPVVSLTEVRHAVRQAIAGRGVPTAHVDDFVVAVNEVVNNAVTHGRPPVEMRLWVTDEEWTCHVIDRGEGFHDPLAGYPGAAQSSLDSPLGLVLVRQLCDELAMRRTREGFVVRLTSHRRTRG